MASREAMNMGSSDSNIVSNIKSLISLLGQETNRAVQTITSGISKVSSFGGGDKGGAAVSSTLVAPNPVFNAPAINAITSTGNGLVSSGPGTPGPSNNLVARGPATNLTEYAASSGAATLYQPEVGSIARGGGSGGGAFGGGDGGGGGTSGSSSQGYGNLPKGIGTAISAAMATYNVASNLAPNTSDALEAQLLQQRASFYTGGGKSGIGAIQASQQSVAQAAMLSGDNPQMDVMRAQIAAQSLGLGSGINNLMKSAANVSNLMPGIGVEGAMRATGSMQQAYNVNMLRGIGIQLRGPGGTLKGPDEVINEVWEKICRDYGQAYGAGKKPSLNEVQISLQPGNALDSMLNQYFGNDPMLKQLVANGLIYKAQGGSTAQGAIKGGVAALGGTTEAMLSYTSTAAAGQAFLTAAEGGAATGFIGANAVVSNYYNDAAKGLVQVLSGIKGFTDTVLTAFGGNPVSAMAGIAGAGAISGFVGVISSVLDFIKSPTGSIKDILTNLFSNTSWMAEGGPVTGNTPYIVGEKGPELFIPDNSGTIVSNDKLTSGNYTYNFTINAPSGTAQDLAAEIKNVLIQLETNRKVSES